MYIERKKTGPMSSFQVSWKFYILDIRPLTYTVLNYGSFTIRTPPLNVNGKIVTKIMNSLSHYNNDERVISQLYWIWWGYVLLYWNHIDFMKNYCTPWGVGHRYTIKIYHDRFTEFSSKWFSIDNIEPKNHVFFCRSFLHEYIRVNSTFVVSNM